MGAPRRGGRDDVDLLWPPIRRERGSRCGRSLPGRTRRGNLGRARGTRPGRFSCRGAAPGAVVRAISTRGCCWRPGDRSAGRAPARGAIGGTPRLRRIAVTGWLDGVCDPVPAVFPFGDVAVTRPDVRGRDREGGQVQPARGRGQRLHRVVRELGHLRVSKPCLDPQIPEILRQVRQFGLRVGGRPFGRRLVPERQSGSRLGGFVRLIWAWLLWERGATAAWCGGTVPRRRGSAAVGGQAGMTHVRLCQNPSETVTDSRSLLQPWDLPGRCVSSAIVPVSAKVKFRPRPPNGHAAASAYIGSS